jgi:hypothetical protein
VSNYTKATDFEAKDSLPSGDPDKVVKGSEIEDEFDAISTAIATKADKASPIFTGTVVVPTPFTIGATSMTSTATELNVLDGITATTAELNLLDGVTAVLDEDDMSSDSATALVTQQSVKAYVDGLSQPVTGIVTIAANSSSQAITGIGFQPRLVEIEILYCASSWLAHSSGSFDGTTNNVIYAAHAPNVASEFRHGSSSSYAYEASSPNLTAQTRGTLTIQSDGFTVVKSNYDSAIYARYTCHP